MIVPEREQVTKKTSESFYVGHYRQKYFERTWHYHPEYELILITNGFGTRVIGDKQSPFQKGDLVLLGGNIPHAWFSDASFFEEDNAGLCESVFIQFERSIFGHRFADLPEMKPIGILLDKARRGLHFDLKSEPMLGKRILDLQKKTGLDRLLSFIAILDLFRRGEYQAIMSAESESTVFIAKSQRIQKVHEYVMQNYREEITVRQIAQLLEMNVSSFCRYFKQQIKQDVL